MPLESLAGYEDDQGDWGDILHHQRPSVDTDECSDSSSDSGSDSQAPQSNPPVADVEPVGGLESISANFPQNDSTASNPEPTATAPHSPPKSSL